MSGSQKCPHPSIRNAHPLLRCSSVLRWIAAICFMAALPALAANDVPPSEIGASPGSAPGQEMGSGPTVRACQSADSSLECAYAVPTGALSPLTPITADSDTTPPVVTQVQPADGASEVPTNLDRITVWFNESMNKDSMLSGIFFTDANGNRMPVNFRMWFENGLQLQFSTLLAPRSLYYVHVLPTVSDFAGNPLGEEFISTFTTGDAPVDTIPPAVISVHPPDGSEGNRVNLDRITVRFTESMDRNSMIYDNIYFTDSDGRRMSVWFKMWFDDGLQLQFPYTLQPRSTYRVVVTTGVKDVAGNHLQTESVTTFQTGPMPVDEVPPQVSWVYPQTGATDIPPTLDRVGVFFDEAMDRITLLNGAIYFTDSTGRRMPISWRWWYDNGLMLNFSYGLLPGATYCVHASTDATDIVGNHLPSEFISCFTVQSENVPPVAVAGPDQTLECTGQRQAWASLDGSGSYDLDSTPGTSDDIEGYLWSEEGQTLAASAIASMPFALGAHPVALTVTDAAGLSDQDDLEVTVQDTQAPAGTITSPPQGACLGPSSAPVTVLDDFSDTCDFQLERGYDPAGGPSYDGHGDYNVTLTVADSSSNVARASVSFTIDRVAPVVLLYPTPDRTVVPSEVPFSSLFLASDDDGAAGGVVREGVYWDGCLVFDGRTYGDADGLLSDEVLKVDLKTFCDAIERCGLPGLDKAVLSVEAQDCGGNVGRASRTIPMSPRLTQNACHTFLSISGRSDSAEVGWSPVLLAWSYDLVRGDVAALRSAGLTVDLGSVACLAREVPLTTVVDRALPTPGQAFFYVTRYRRAGVVSEYGWSSADEVRRPAGGGCED